MKRQTAQRAIVTCKIALLVLIVLAIWQGIVLYSYFQEHPQKEYTWKAYEEPPKEAVIKSTLINRSRNIMLIGIGVMILSQVFMYYREPDNHWFAPIYNRLKKMEIENDEEKKD